MTEIAANSSPGASDQTGGIVIAQADSSSASGQTGGISQTNPPVDIVIPSNAYELPQPGGELIVVIPGNATVRLADPAFNPVNASYAVDGFDLYIQLADGGRVRLVDFFDSSAPDTSLSVLGGPQVTALALLEESEVGPIDRDLSEIEPAGGPVHGGGAGFAPFEPGSLPPALQALGPLGPTEIGFGLGPIIIDDEFFEEEDGDGGGAGAAPVLSLRSEVTDVVVDEGRGFNPPALPVLPIKGPGIPIPESEINNIPREQVTLDETREVNIIFVDEDSISIDSLFVYDVTPEGFLVNVRPVFPFVNKVGDPLKPAELQPGDSVSLGEIEAGTEFGLLVLNDGGRRNDPDVFEGGSYELLNPITGNTTNIGDFDAVGNPQGRPVLQHTAEDGTVTDLESFRLFSADESQETPNNNRLNPDDMGHFVSGFDTETGLLIVGVEDGINRRRDDDFDDDVFAIGFGTTQEFGLYTIDPTGGLRASITDPDGGLITGSAITLVSEFAGDRLVLDPAAVAGTNIVVEQLADGSLQITGADTISNYEAAISAVRLDVDETNPLAGERIITATITDDSGLTSEPVETRFDVTFDTLTPDDPASDLGDVIIGTNMADTINGGAGDDFIAGGLGNDLINGNAGDDTLTGGSGQDNINPGSGADLIRYRGLSDGMDEVEAYNPAEGDAIDLRDLFTDTSFDPDNPDESIRILTVDGDNDGANDDFRIEIDIDGEDGPLGWVAILDLNNPLSGSPSIDGLNILLPQEPAEQTVS